MEEKEEKGVSGVLRAGMAVTLVGSLMVPSTAALAKPSSDDASQPADQAADDAQDSDGSATDVSSLLKQKGADASDSDTAKGNLLPEGVTDPSEQVTIVVQLEDGGSQGVNLLDVVTGNAQQARHNHFKNAIRDLSRTVENNDGVQLYASDADAGVEEVQDYYHVIDGFAVKAPAGTLQDIKNLDGVKAAFVEQVHSIPQDEESTAAEATTDLKNQSSLNMTGADQVDQKGDGQTVAIIDSGVSTGHEAFSGDLDDSKVALSQDAANGEIKDLGHGTYVSEKIPYARDYADGDDDVNPSSVSGMEHGTHVAGITAANGGDEIRGTAPHSQIIAMKVARDFDGGLPDSAILAALDDSAVLKPDSINMSFGIDAGFSDDAANVYADAFSKLDGEGVSLNVAAGNAYSAALMNSSGKNLPYATDPDSGIVGSPATIPSGLAVASVNNSEPKSAFLGPDGQVISYNLMGIQENGQNNGKTSPDLYTIADGDYDIVDMGYGTADEANAWGEKNNYDATGKIVLVERGSADGSQITFTQKVQNVLAGAGMGWPAAIIIYNNEDGEITNAAVQDMVLNYPVVTISKADGEAIKNAKTKKVTLKKGTVAAASTDYTMSDFSSWGVTPDMKLKPEVTAPGGNIWSSVPDNKYEYMSGTSMATPQITGINALVDQYVKENSAKGGKFANLSDSERNDLVTQLVMSTAKPVASTSVSGSYVSPREQGAGLANVPAATSTDVYATVDGADQASRPKAELGDSADGSWSFTVTLHNVGGEAKSFTPDTAALSEQVADGLFQQKSDNWTGKGIDVSYSGDAYSNGKVTVPANGTASYTVTVKAGKAFTDWAAANTPNGTFVDGFAMLKADEGGVDLSVPFLGFYGDWAKANAFDAQLLAGKQSADNADGYHAYGSAASDPNGLPLGVNLLDPNAAALVKAGDYSKVDPNKMVVSNMGYDSAPSQLIPLTGLLRSADNLTYTYKNSDGDVVRTYSHDYTPKSYYYQVGGYMLAADSRIGSYSPFDGKNDQGVRLPDGKYTLERTATIAGTDGQTQTDQSQSFYYDTTGPQISNVKYEGTGDDRTVSFDITDDSWLAAYDFHDPTTGAYFYRINPTEDPDTNDDGSHTWSFKTKISDIKAAWEKSEQSIGSNDPVPNTVPLYAWDYGLNPTAAPVSIVVTPVAATSITLSSTEVSLAPGQDTQLTATVQPENSTEKDLVWTSSDDKVVTVDEKGKLTGVGVGSATVTAASAINPDVKAEAKVTVASVSEDAGIVAATQTTQALPDGTTEVKALLAPSLSGADVKWTSSSDDTASVTESKTDGVVATATVKTGSDIGDATLTATVTKDGKELSASTTVKVRPANYGDFVIDEKTGTLLGYAGTSSYVDIPNNVTRINDQAFMGTPVQEVNVPASVVSIGKQAFYNAAKLETVTFEDTAEHPAQLTTVEDGAFSSTVKLKTVKLPHSVTKLGTGVFENSTIWTADLGSVSEIPANTFSMSAQVFDVTVPDYVTKIGDNAFGVAQALSELKLSHVDGKADGEVKGLPSQLRTIGNGAFTGTAFSGTLTLPSGVTSLGDGAFSLTKLTAVNLNNGLEYFGGGAFSGTQISEITVPDSVKRVGSGLFAQMTALKKVTLNDDMPADSLDGAFIDDQLLSEIVVSPNSKNYASVDNVLFNKDKTKLITYKLAVTGDYKVPDGTQTIAGYAFFHSKVANVTFPDSLKEIGSYGFGESTLEGDLVLPDGFTTMGDNAFKSTLIKSANIGGATSLATQAFYMCDNLTTINLRTDLNKLQSIGNGAFGMSPNITEIIMPDSLTKIGDMAFANMEKLQKVHIGAGLTGDISGFVTGSNNLKELTVSENNPVYSADHNVLYGKMSDGQHLILSLPTNDIEEYVVKAGTVQIDAQAFRNNAKLKKVTLPEGIKKLDTGAFNNCTALTDINFPDSLTYVDGFYSVPLSVADFGPNVSVFGGTTGEAFMGNNPDHLVLRGMTGNGKYQDSMDFTEDPNTALTAYFGPGVKTVDFGNSAPNITVLPETITRFSLSGGALNTNDNENDTAANTQKKYIFAPKDKVDMVKSSMKTELEDMKNATFEWFGKLPADFDVDKWVAEHVKEYTPLSLSLENAGATTPGQTVKVTAKSNGGVDESFGKKQYRFFQTNADGTKTQLQDWSDNATIDWKVPADGSALQAEVRDASWFTVTSEIGEVSAPTLSRDLDTTPIDAVEGEELPLLAVSGSTVEGNELSYQWYEDGKAIDGATQASYVPESKAGKHEYYVVVTSSANGGKVAVKSSTVPVTVYAKASAPKMAEELPAVVVTKQGASVVLNAVAEAPTDGGVLSYQWYRDGEAIDGATDALYVAPADAGTHRYSVKVTNTLGLERNTASIEGGSTLITAKGSFADVAGDSWYHDSVVRAAELGYMSGYAGTDLFGPEDTLTRAQAAAVLFNMAGADEADYDGSFADVAAGDWFAGPVAWAKASGVMSGYEGTDLFGSGDSLTREQMAAALYNYAKNVAKQDVSVDDVDGTLAKFGDADRVGGWAREAVAWAIDRGIMGKGGSIDAQAPITRAEIAAMAVDFQPTSRL